MANKITITFKWLSVADDWKLIECVYSSFQDIPLKVDSASSKKSLKSRYLISVNIGIW